MKLMSPSLGLMRSSRVIRCGPYPVHPVQYASTQLQAARGIAGYVGASALHACRQRVEGGAVGAVRPTAKNLLEDLDVSADWTQSHHAADGG